MKIYFRKYMCDNCPFLEEGAGLQLRLSLKPSRWQDVLSGLRAGEHFLCHKTTKGEEDDDGNYQGEGTERICAGSREYQQSLGIVSNFEQIHDRLTAPNGPLTPRTP